MSDQSQRELDVIESVANKGGITKFFAYARISGPGWLQGAITLGGGSLAGALYLGIVAGNDLLWVQPLAMICGIIMLAAIAYVTLSTEQRPLQLINQHLHPLLGWSWVVATIMANIVWTMPQFSLGTAAIQQNLLGVKGDEFLWPIIIVLFGIGLFVNYLYQAEGGGAKLFDKIIKGMVGLIVLSFFAVVIALFSNGSVSFGSILSGFIPDFSLLGNSSPTFASDIAASSNPGFWEGYIVDTQKSKIFAAFGTAVGINMTFLLPYTLLKKKWSSKHRGLSITDLSIGLFVPFFLATACVVIASASSFHGKTEDVNPLKTYSTLAKIESVKALVADLPKGTDEEKEIWNNTVANAPTLTESDFKLAAMLHSRDAGALAITLKPFTGEVVGQKVFGLGVLGMAVSTIIILMLINGLAFQQLFEKALGSKASYYLGCGISGFAGCMFPFLWKGESKAALAIPTSVIGGSLIPIAYFTFFLLMNSKKVLGDKRPEGTARIIWNVLMIFATTVATVGTWWATSGKKFGDVPAGMIGMSFLVLLFVVGTASFFIKEKKA
ncbi:divalent metal cation transporter [Akkermansiaceae bacterium]|nr:divalent metal cation transporter [Akkermansiaceae bacterium]MDA7936021.1 divalent metal cation transporter [bacterium]MDA7935354.1 divalent metal cation transporter [Akkermansiaceae bacterium]MDB4406781.1 divalent metal cation transporter [Akkermansiaceae bacterium]MDB4440070.1 divalent metal cation transporter [bacterium]